MNRSDINSSVNNRGEHLRDSDDLRYKEIEEIGMQMKTQMQSA